MTPIYLTLIPGDNTFIFVENPYFDLIFDLAKSDPIFIYGDIYNYCNICLPYFLRRTLSKEEIIGIANRYDYRLKTKQFRLMIPLQTELLKLYKNHNS